MKKCISFSGQSRFIKEGLKTLEKNLVDFDEYDIFIHTWENEKSKDCFLYNTKKCIIEPQKEDIIPEESKNFDPLFFNDPRAFIHYSMFYSMKQSILLKQNHEKENNFKYDAVIRTRFDISLEDKIDIKKFNLRDGVFSPDVCGNKDVISDWFNFSTSENIDIYTTMYDEILNIHKAGMNCFAGENIISKTLSKHKIKYNRFPCSLYLLRPKDFIIPHNGDYKIFWKNIE